MGSAYKLFYKDPLHIVRGEGVWLYDEKGDAYLDVYNNVPHVGHCHPRVVEALHQQASKLNTHTRYLNENVLNYTERLTATFPEPLNMAMFACTGTEANELAMRIARVYTGGTGFIVTENAYHGNSQGVAEISMSYPGEMLDRRHVETIPAPDLYRGPFRAGDEQAVSGYAGLVSDAVERLQTRGIKPAAFIVDTIFSSDGVINFPAGFLCEAARIMHQAGALLIADEVQPGFGRTGTGMWGFQRHQVVPDIVTLGKPMGNGHPISGMVTSEDILKKFCETTKYFNTFGGNPVSCAVASAVLDVLEEEQLTKNALEVGSTIQSGLQEMAGRHELIGEIRGSGLFIAIELVENPDTLEPATQKAERIVNHLRRRKILIGSTGRYANVLKIRPPMPFSEQNADLFLETFDQVLGTTK